MRYQTNTHFKRYKETTNDVYQIDVPIEEEEDEEEDERTTNIEVIKKEIIIRKLDKRNREIHFINPEDAKLFDNIESWVKNNRNETFERTIEKFSKELIGDALVKVIFDYPFPDFIIKYKNDQNMYQNKENRRKRQNFEKLLLNAGLIVEHENFNGFIYMKIISPFEKLCEQAQKMKIKLPLNKESIKDSDSIPEESTIFSTITDFLSYRGKFNKHSTTFVQEKLLEFEGTSKMSTSQIKLNFFSTAKRNLMVHRMIMTANHISQSVMIGDKSTLVKRRINSLAIDLLIKEKVFIKFYPIHDGLSKVYEEYEDNNDEDEDDEEDEAFKIKREENLRMELNEIWVKPWGPQPIEKIREYFGEKLALYFVWIGFYNSWLTVAAIGGIIVVIYGLICALSQNSLSHGISGIAVIVDNALTLPYAFFMSIWATLYLESWKRTNVSIQYDWNMMDYEKNELPRSNFYGTDIRTSPITMKQEIYFPFHQKLKKLFITGAIIFISVCILIFTIGVVIVVPKALIHIGIYTTLVTAFVNLITMITVKLLSKYLALKLTDIENHKTDTEYEDALILKTFIFDFFNYYSGLFYILLFKQQFVRVIVREIIDRQETTGCEYDNCLIELTIQLAILLIGKQLFDQFMEIFMPWLSNNFSKENLKVQLKNMMDKYKHNKKNTNIPQWIHDDYLADFPKLQKNENGKIVVQFGFIVLFGPAFPLASFFSWINNLIEIKTDSFKYIKTTKRPVAYQAQDIGIWENILHILSMIGVLTNAIMIAFYSNWALAQFLKYTGDDDNLLLIVRLGFVLVFEHLVFIFKLIFVYFIPNQPSTLREAIEREKYLVKIKFDDKFKPELDEIDDNHFTYNIR
ncbi:hypothetical protein Glove_227g72 [Diversispora epigaea]|uniref:Uncharacterized protein n=1 Tax=Diversispora epigaea TaxID=1348612 RepID=A0A397IDU2_9GLOM|nr:hypothetical protein Glove_227g72 [Diversispora epigaea]